MRVDDAFTPSSDLRSLQVERSPQTDAQEARRSRGAEDRTGDSVSLSAIGVELSRALAGDSPERIAEVERAQQAYETGTLNEPAGEVADALIADALSGTETESRLGGQEG